MLFRILLPLAVLLLALAPAAPAAEAVQTYGMPGIITQVAEEGAVTIMAGSLDWLERAKALESQGDWAALLAWGQRWSEDEPGNPLAWYVQGRANSELQRHPEAIAAYQENLRLDPADVHAYTSLGNAYRNSQRYREALNAYRQTLRVKPDCIRAWHNLGLTFYTLKGLAGMALALQALRTADPELADAWQELAGQYSKSGDEREARRAIQLLGGLDADRRERLFDLVFAGL